MGAEWMRFVAQIGQVFFTTMNGSKQEQVFAFCQKIYDVQVERGATGEINLSHSVQNTDELEW